MSSSALAVPAAQRRRRAVSVSLVTLLGGALAVGLAPQSPASADGGRTTYSTASQQCQIKDSRLSGVSGISAIRGRVYVMNDSAPATVYTIDSLCRVTAASPVKVSVTDVEDLIATPDGAFWLADIGGNRVRRQVISLFHWSGSGTAAERFDLRYPDGVHDAEAMLVSLAGQVVVITKASNGRSEVYAASLPLAKTNQLQKVGDLNVAALRRPGDNAPGSLLITGGAVAPDGTHFVLRTYTSAYEWDAPDGDVVAAMATGKPRPIPLAKEAQGEAIAYAEDGTRLLTTTEKLPAPLHGLTVTRAQPPGQEPAAVSMTPEVAFGAGASVLLIAGIASLSWRRRRLSTRVTTYQSAG
jgi:hypothetical protein